jgi:NAD(P)-dependent dehydrogenase (short-subunit alcohol dehydrogenase family)
MRMQGKVAYVSGSTRGIGRTIAELFAREGAKVAVTGRTVAKGEKVVQRIREAGGEAEFFRLDVTEEDSVRGVIDAVVERFGKLDTLINNAAPTDAISTSVKPLSAYTTAEWDHILCGTLTGNVFWPWKYGVPHLKQAGGGNVVNISSGHAIVGIGGFAPYAAAKGGMNAITRVLAVEGSPYNIKVNTIIVGRVVSHSADTGVGVGGGHLTPRLGTPDDIAYSALWLASDENGFATGSLVTVDGGMTINGSAILGFPPEGPADPS